jgi:hypothetical protein
MNNRNDAGTDIVMRHTGIRSTDMSMDPSGSGRLNEIEAKLDVIAQALVRLEFAGSQRLDQLEQDGAARLDQIEAKLDRLLHPGSVL